MSNESDDSDGECLSPIIPIKRRKFIADASIQVQSDPQTLFLNTSDDFTKGTDYFSRSCYIRSIVHREGHDGVLAVVMSTFSVDVPTLLLDFPDLCSSSATIPTYILHGHRRNDLGPSLLMYAASLSSRLMLCEVAPQQSPR